MFAYSDPTGTGFLEQAGALQRYREKVGVPDAEFHTIPVSVYARRDAFRELVPGTQAETATIEWKAFPVSQSGTPAAIDRNRFKCQDEYVEWRVETEGGSLRRATFTTEFREYFEALAEVSADALKEEIRRIYPGANPTDEEVFGARFNPATANAMERARRFNANLQKNPWNNGQRGILCLTHPASTLSALIHLLGTCGMPRGGDPGEVCANLGGACVPGRSSDPAMCIAAQNLARAGRSFSLEDPCGVRIIGLDPTVQWTVDGQAVDMNDETNNRGIWKVTRNGRRGTFTFHGDVRLAGVKIRTGTDLSRQLIVGATVLHAPNTSLPDKHLIVDATVSQAPPATPAKSTRTAPARPEVDAYVRFSNDAPCQNEDTLERGPLALFLARRLHLIWCEMNGCPPRPKEQANGGPLIGEKLSPRRESEGDTFIVHIDAPWGGGKTTFANFVARVLNPCEERLSERHFLRTVAGPLATAQELEQTKLDEIFFADPDAKEDDRLRWPPEARRPWIVARYNAWRDQYVYPPWWHIFLTIQGAIYRELHSERTSVAAHLGRGHRWKEALDCAWRRAGVQREKIAYQLWNAKIRHQLTLLMMAAVLVLIVWQTGLVTYILDRSGAIDPKKGKEWIDLTVAAFGFAGVSIATLFTVISQSLSPDLDFTAEHKQIGVRDPIGRFRRIFGRILHHAKRPVLLILDDIDRCEPKAVVEILRGFQTIIRSSRLIVLVLGDRAWIERAHEIYHKDFTGIMVGTESTLGARFVEKMFQLSFTLPAMTPEVRHYFTRAVLEGPPYTRPAADDVLKKLEKDIGEAIATTNTVAEREEKVETAKQTAIQQGGEKKQIDTLATIKLVAAAASDAGYGQEVSNVLLELAASLPNNPRQIKRIINAFAVYETVGRLYFNYQLTANENDDDAAMRARRWRQLAMWVTLATEWPDTWRALAREPRLIDAAYLKNLTERKRVRQTLSKTLASNAARKQTQNIIHRLYHDRLLLRLFGMDGRPAQPTETNERDRVTELFAGTKMESMAIYDFNRIMWEPGFPTRNPMAIHKKSGSDSV